MIFEVINLIYAIRSIVWGLGFTVAGVIVLMVMIYGIGVMIFEKDSLPADLRRKR